MDRNSPNNKRQFNQESDIVDNDTFNPCHKASWVCGTGSTALPSEDKTVKKCRELELNIRSIPYVYQQVRH